MNSMTGFGRGIGQWPGGSFTVEVSGVNSRYLDIVYRSGKEFNFWEPRLRAQIKERLCRGKLSINLHCNRNDSALPQLSESGLQQLGALATTMQRDYGVQLQIDPVRLFASELFVSAAQAKSELPPDVPAAMDAALAMALDKLVQMRAIEGAAITVELERILGEIEPHWARVTAAAPKVSERIRQRLQTKVADVLQAVSEQRKLSVELEVAMLVDRADITEELARFNSHIDQFRSSIKESGRIGKKLDFICQELFREANTVASKCNDFAISTAIIAIKNEIEKLREQVQNIE